MNTLPKLMAYCYGPKLYVFASNAQMTSGSQIVSGYAFSTQPRCSKTVNAPDLNVDLTGFESSVKSLIK